MQMVRDIEDALDREIDTLEWMGGETKVKAKAKLHKVANKIGYPDTWRDYSNLKIARGDALGNQWKAVEFENRRTVRENRQAGGSPRVWNDASDGQCLLQRQHE